MHKIFKSKYLRFNGLATILVIIHVGLIITLEKRQLGFIGNRVSYNKANAWDAHPDVC